MKINTTTEQSEIALGQYMKLNDLNERNAVLWL